mgnify:CR=1 FL=1|jgi:hypothetical protein|tara:strand:- start:1417 stop:1614 length:198 start_codon:yes stop_codon:yes gene_type:complete
MKKRTHKLLEQAQSLVTSVTGTDIPKTTKGEVMKEVRAIYRKIKEIDEPIYKILNDDDNHKTISK